ncbi:hypothetical protein PF005_g14954 [Phytophthora fragariae]|uniref:Uncharacterized protein n=1 Tax=Phytophthora fragariae TaxID=53985 RepID=A0A6A3YIQ9_9STRA|nr:hypothetical protein PF003_g14051 [Phytophthora fragariae]KAE8934150.1 hypothetical protein PF009_g15866 [Phytophthora fragariae]KAE8997307.1 hypothetical protein PF011_g15539 [Phytophthora fragariae]KAE9097659.1 hypothetical protein PF010_g15868 [Phytophthora fragariae]KAE9102116.1 hypothetical protein PF007_g14874 [Phytophthora fragariae]
MLLSALNQKDGELQQMCCDYGECVHANELLRDKLADERAPTKRVMREKDETATQLAEQRRLFENLQRVDDVHHSQLELLQKRIIGWYWIVLDLIKIPYPCWVFIPHTTYGQNACQLQHIT